MTIFPAPAWTLTAVPYASPGAQRLAQALHAEQLAVYGHADDPASTPPHEFDPPAGLFLVIFPAGGGPAVGGGGWRAAGHRTAEVKRMYVDPACRGRGLGRILLSALEYDAARHGHAVMILETGILNHAALTLYARAGYGPVRSYVPGRDPGINRAMAKNLPAARTAST